MMKILTLQTSILHDIAKTLPSHILQPLVDTPYSYDDQWDVAVSNCIIPLQR